MVEFKVGDKVTEFYRGGFSYTTCPTRVTAVERITPTKMVLKTGSEWKIDGSRPFRRLQGYSFPHVEHWRQEHSDFIALQNAKSAVTNFVSWERLSDDQIKRVYAVINEWRGQQVKP